MIGPNDLLHPSPAPHFKTFQVFLLCCPKRPSFSTIQRHAPNLIPLLLHNFRICIDIVHTARRWRATVCESLCTRSKIINNKTHFKIKLFFYNQEICRCNWIMIWKAFVRLVVFPWVVPSNGKQLSVSEPLTWVIEQISSAVPWNETVVTSLHIY